MVAERPHRRSEKRWVVTAGVVVALSGLGASAFAILVRRDERLTGEQELRIDDVGFSVEGVAHPNAIATDGRTLVPEGELWVLSILFANHAARIDHELGQYHLTLAGSDGVNRPGTLVHAGTCPGAVSRGEACTVDVAFDVPAATDVAELQVSTGNATLDHAYDLVFGRKRIVVPR